jgi:hypothetical protein
MVLAIIPPPHPFCKVGLLVLQLGAFAPGANAYGSTPYDEGCASVLERECCRLLDSLYSLRDHLLGVPEAHLCRFRSVLRTGLCFTQITETALVLGHTSGNDVDSPSIDIHSR